MRPSGDIAHGVVRRRRGATLLELLVVVGLMLLLLSIVVVGARALWNAVMQLKDPKPPSTQSSVRR